MKVAEYVSDFCWCWSLW